MDTIFNLRLDIDDTTSRRLALPQMTCPFKLKVISTVRAFDRAVANLNSYLRPDLFVEYHNHIQSLRKEGDELAENMVQVRFSRRHTKKFVKSFSDQLPVVDPRPEGMDDEQLELYSAFSYLNAQTCVLYTSEPHIADEYSLSKFADFVFNRILGSFTTLEYKSLFRRDKSGHLDWLEWLHSVHIRDIHRQYERDSLYQEELSLSHQGSTDTAYYRDLETERASLQTYLATIKKNPTKHSAQEREEVEVRLAELHSLIGEFVEQASDNFSSSVQSHSDEDLEPYIDDAVLAYLAQKENKADNYVARTKDEQPRASQESQRYDERADVELLSEKSRDSDESDSAYLAERRAAAAEFGLRKRDMHDKPLIDFQQIEAILDGKIALESVRGILD